ncbi:hypothetical protein RJ640_012880 [Escallonia rubra]|uniref:DWNN domain-containing protein n=1 Tax=Escallonia rubra TaxID=112253 RepID=A0AA88S584_9ASTE|nr:hypothetical protein RJ640_012880 [Escallonia rubra]
MAVYYKFKSAKDYDSIAMDGHFISVGTLKEKIFESKHLGRGTDFDLVVTNAQTNEEYLDEEMVIPKNTSVLIRRVPGRPRMTIVTAPVPTQNEPILEEKATEPTRNSFLGADPSVSTYVSIIGLFYMEFPPDDSEWDEFGNDLYAIPEVQPIQSTSLVQDAPPPSKADEDSKIKALIESTDMDWQRQTPDGFGPGRGFGRGGRMPGGRGFGRVGFERKTPPQGYICHRCKVPGHFIQHCPTNGDPNYDVKRSKPPTGIPKSMLMATPDGPYALSSGVVAVLKPNEAAFEREIEGMPSTRSVGDLPRELLCPLCKEVMKDAVLTSKCCFSSFCDKCIREYIISKSVCVCGATNVLADDLLPNKTVRDTINRILESNNSSAENVGSAFQVQDMESARCPQPKVPSPTQSVASRGEQVAPLNEETTKIQETSQQGKALSVPQQTSEQERTSKLPDVSEATHDSRSMKEAASQGPLADEEVQQNQVGDAGKKKKKKKTRLPMSAAEMQWRTSQDFVPAENFMMPMGPSAYDPYWTGMQPGMEGYMGPYAGAGAMPFMGYGLGPFDVPFGGPFPQQQPFGAGYMPPFIPPQRDLADFGMGLNGGPRVMSREEFEARKADLRRKREIERRDQSREVPRDREFVREVSSSGDMVQKSSPPPSAADHHHHHRHRTERERLSPDRHARDPEPPRASSKRKSSDYDDYHYDDSHRSHHHRSHHRSETSTGSRPQAAPTSEPAPPKSSSTTSAAAAAAAAAAEQKKASVFSRISFPEGEAAASKKRKVAASTSEAPANGYHEDSYKAKKSLAAAVDYESSDDDRHFKRRPARYESSLPAAAEEPRHGRGSREKERDRGGYSKHR